MKKVVLEGQELLKLTVETVNCLTVVRRRCKILIAEAVQLSVKAAAELLNAREAFRGRMYDGLRMNAMVAVH